MTQMQQHPNIWIASFPRSGNTFLRNVMHMAYRLTSSTYGFKPDGSLLFEDYSDHPLIKTHQRPFELPVEYPVIYLVRDGRDALVSMAHHRKDIVEPGTDFMSNLQEAIIAAEGSYFGGWSSNALEWIAKADAVIRFEDLIQNPIHEIEKCQHLLSVGPTDAATIPNFEDLKSGKGIYTDDVRKSDDEDWKAHTSKFFRKGKVGNWKEEMPEEQQELFWKIHGEAMEILGYSRDGTMVSNDGFVQRIDDYRHQLNTPVKKTYRVLLEGSKILDPYQDGVKRYVYGLMKGLQNLPVHHTRDFQIDLYAKGVIRPLLPVVRQRPNTEKKDLKLNQLDFYVRLYERFKAFLREVLPKAVYRFIRGFYVNLQLKKTVNYILKLYLEVYFRYAQTKIKKLSSDYDLIHVTLPQNIRPFRLATSKILVTVHDLTHRLFPEYHTRENRRNAERGMRKAATLQSAYLTVSDSTTRDLMSTYPIKADNVRSVYEAADHERFQPIRDQNKLSHIREKYGLTDKPYFLSLFTLEPRKNLKNTLLAYETFRANNPQSDIQFAVAGRIGWKADGSILDHPGIRAIGYIEEDDLAGIYTGALGFCYVSRYEGFGLPLLEAMLCRTPVIYGDNSSMREWVQDAGIAANPNDEKDIAGAMAQLANQPERRESLAAAAYKKAISFSWEKAAQETLAYYRDLIDN